VFSLTDIAVLLIQALWFIAPAYAANGFPPVMQGRRPIDGKKLFRGKRLLGDGKTWEGTLGGIMAGILVGVLQIVFQSDLAFLNLDLPAMTIALVIALSAGTMAGDLIGSFIKRRIDIKRGDAAPLLDQEGFLVAAVILAALTYNINLAMVAVLLLITPPIHWASNICGFYMKFKKKPW
jgi:CDP-2,3-bis-(O-geranylgeranyl)-sn-glycerol synthase